MLLSEVEVEYFDRKGCQYLSIHYNEVTDTNIWKQVTVEAVLFLVLPSIPTAGNKKGKSSAFLLSSCHVSSNQAPFFLSFPCFGTSEYL